MPTKQLDQQRMSSLISAVPCLGYSDLLLVLLVVVDTLDVLAPEVLGVEFQTKVREDFTITAKAPTRVFHRLKAPASSFIFKTLLRHYAECLFSMW